MSEENSSRETFCIDDYDCIGFDMDHTMVQYQLPQTFKVSSFLLLIFNWHYY